MTDAAIRDLIAAVNRLTDTITAVVPVLAAHLRDDEPGEPLNSGSTVASSEPDPALWREREFAEFLPAVDRLLTWADEIFDFDACDRVSNGRVEGRMNKLGVLKRTGSGFVNPEHFAARASSSAQVWHLHHDRDRTETPHGIARNRLRGFHS